MRHPNNIDDGIKLMKEPKGDKFMADECASSSPQQEYVHRKYGACGFPL